jgi:hypothetical protein
MSSFVVTYHMENKTVIIIIIIIKDIKKGSIFVIFESGGERNCLEEAAR